MSILLIYNPTSGKGKSIRVVSEVVSHLKELKKEHVVYESKSRKNLIKYVEENIEKYETIFGVGGDGTIRDIVFAMQKIKSKVPLGVIPAGSGNDLIKSLEHEEDIKGLVNKYLSSKASSIYSCTCNQDTFINIAGIGIDVDILKRRLNLKKYFSGSLCYALAALQGLIAYKPKSYRITLDDRTIEGTFYIVAIANGKYLGGGMKISPNANLKDKKLNIIVLRKVNKIKLLRAFSKIYSGKHVDLPYIDEYFSEKIEIDFLGRKEYINYDGDLLEGHNLIAEKNIDRNINVLV